MNFKEEIDRAARELEYELRDNQPEVISKVLTEFLINKKRNVILCLDTGSGKSIIGATVAKVLENKKQPKLVSAILMHQNALTNQYFKSFEHLSDFSNIRGASTYKCNYIAKTDPARAETANAESCVKSSIPKFQQEAHCKGCEYDQKKSVINKIPHLITNYSYYFATRFGILEPRLINVFDEAHVLNDVYSEGFAINVTEKILNDYIKDLEKENDDRLKDIIESFNIAKTLFLKVNANNYNRYIDKYSELVYKTSQKYYEIADLSRDVIMQADMMKKSERYLRVLHAINKYKEYEKNYVVDCKEAELLSIKPIFISHEIEQILAEYNLFMSGTISKVFANTTFGLRDEETVFISEPSVFLPENRPVFFLGKQNLNASAMNNDSVIDDLKKTVNHILGLHKNDKGIIQTPSFVVSDIFSESLKKSGVKVFSQERGQSVADVVEEFKSYTKPSVLISPSLWEGVDLEGENSRFQIIVKTPYASLGDRRISYIANQYGSIYQQQTLYKLLQGIGRSARNKQDWCKTYFLDKSSEAMYNSTNNLWKDRYKVSTLY